MSIRRTPICALPRHGPSSITQLSTTFTFQCLNAVLTPCVIYISILSLSSTAVSRYRKLITCSTLPLIIQATSIDILLYSLSQGDEHSYDLFYAIKIISFTSVTRIQLRHITCLPRCAVAHCYSS